MRPKFAAEQAVEKVHAGNTVLENEFAAEQAVEKFVQPERFDHLIALCTCDFRAYPGRASRPYPKAPMLRTALSAFRGVDEAAVAADALLEARAQAVAAALRSRRWEAQAEAPPALQRRIDAAIASKLAPTKAHLA